MQERAVAGAQAADKLMRRYPYSTAGFAFALGLLTAWCLRRRNQN
jgi:ElaB/YqjD/DUF883 family membrane-anchored ribosome-binding protein